MKEVKFYFWKIGECFIIPSLFYFEPIQVYVFVACIFTALLGLYT